MRRTRLSLAALVAASCAFVGAPTAVLAAPAATTTVTDPAAPTTTEVDEGAVVAEEPVEEPIAEEPVAEEPADALPEEAPVVEEPVAESAVEEPVSEEPVVAEPVEEPVVAESADVDAAAPAVAAVGDLPVQLLAFNDFHGRISGDGTAVPGAALLATERNAARDAFVAAGGVADDSVLVSNGDLIGASPFDSAVFRDEPTIEVANALGVVAGSVGNHEFDRGQDELYRVSAATDGEASDDVTACEPTLVQAEVDGCYTDSTGSPFAGLQSPYLAANVVDGSGEPILPAYSIVELSDGRRIALIGVVTEETPTIVIPSGVEGLTFEDPAQALNEYAAEVTDVAFPGGPVSAVVGLVHEGGAQGSSPADPNACAAVTGEIAAIDAATDLTVDMLVTGHTHQPYVCDSGEFRRPITEAAAYGAMLTDIRFTISATGAVQSLSAVNRVIDPAAAPDSADPQVAEIEEIVDYWQQRSAEAGAETVGTQTADLDRAYRAGSAVRDSESGLGNLIADAQLAAMQDPALGAAQIAFMNPGGIRADINCLSSGPADPDGNITLAESFTTQPFGNTVNTIRMTPDAIHDVLEQQWRTNPDGSVTFLHLSVSEGFSYEFDPTAPVGDRVDPYSITLDGAPLTAATYTIAANVFLTGGGDGFTAFTTGTDLITGPLDADALNAYLAAASPVAPPALGRVVSLDPTQPFDDDGSGTGSCDLSTPGTPTNPEQPGEQPAGPGTPGGSGTGTPAPHVRPVAGGMGGGAAVGGAAKGSLAYTGTALPVGTLLGIGGALVAAGVALTATGYRRRRGLAD